MAAAGTFYALRHSGGGSFSCPSGEEFVAIYNTPPNPDLTNIRAVGVECVDNFAVSGIRAELVHEPGTPAAELAILEYKDGQWHTTHVGSLGLDEDDPLCAVLQQTSYADSCAS
jgi:hypothetical protein